MIKKRLYIFSVLLLVTAAVTGGEVIDRIAAVVNDEIILLSEVEEKMFILAAQGQLQGRDSTEVNQVRRDILDRLIEEKLVVQRARSQGIGVDDEEVRRKVDEAMEKVKGQFPTPADFQKALDSEGITESMLRERYEKDVRQELLGQRIVGREIRNEVEVTSDQVKRFYEENQDQIPPKPDRVHLAHLVKMPLSPEREQEALDRIRAARRRITAGEDFADVAKDVSEDPSGPRGGMLGWFSPGDLDPDFEAAVDTLEIGELSEPVRTRFGYHLIQVMDRQDDRFQVRHILVLVEASGAEIERARREAEAALARIRGGEDFAKVAAEVSDDPVTRDEGGDLGWTDTQSLLTHVAAMVDTMAVGDVSDVVQTDRGYHVFRLLDREKGGTFTYDEIRDRLRGLLEQQEMEKVYDKWMGAIRDSAYIEIKAWTR